MNQKSEDVSVVIPFFNAGETIDRAVRSVLGQTTLPREILVVDDYSNEDHRFALKRLEESCSILRVIWLTQNGGPSVARNRGIDESAGTFLSFLDSDDYWFADKIETVVRLMKNGGLVFLGHNNRIGDRNKVTINDRIHLGSDLYRMKKLDVYVTTSQFAPTTVTYRKDKIPLRFDGTIRRSEDYRLWGDLIFQGYDLWKSTAFLAGRDDDHILGRGLSGNAALLMSAHLSTVDHFGALGYISGLEVAALKMFIRLKYSRHNLRL